MIREHRPDNAMADPGEIVAFRDACSPLMGALLLWVDDVQAEAIREAATPT